MGAPLSVTSKDGTAIAYERAGSGPPVVLADGAFCSRKFGPMPKLAPLLAPRFTVYWYDRRGRGDSGDAPPYAVERELEDLSAVIDAVGAPVFLYGISSGAALALRATAAGAKVKKLCLYEPPLVLPDSPGPLPPDRMVEIEGLVREGKRGEAVKAFMRMVGVPALAIPLMRIIPGVWSSMTAVADTLPHDFALLGHSAAGKPMPPELAAAMAAIAVPTLVSAGGKSPPYLRHAAEAAAKSIEGARFQLIPGQTHNLDGKALRPVLEAFFA